MIEDGKELVPSTVSRGASLSLFINLSTKGLRVAIDRTDMYLFGNGCLKLRNLCVKGGPPPKVCSKRGFIYQFEHIIILSIWSKVTLAYNRITYLRLIFPVQIYLRR